MTNLALPKMLKADGAPPTTARAFRNVGPGTMTYYPTGTVIIESAIEEAVVIRVPLPTVQPQFQEESLKFLQQEFQKILRSCQMVLAGKKTFQVMYSKVVSIIII